MSTPATPRGLGPTGRLAAATARHPWITIVLWIALITGAVVASAGLADVLTQDGELLVETESTRGADLIDDVFGGDDADPLTEFVVVNEPAGVDQGALAVLATELADVDGVAAVAGPHLGVPGMVNDDGTVALLQVTFVDDGRTDEDLAVPLVEALAESDSGLDGLAFGNGSISNEFNELAEENLTQAEAVGLPIALLILILVFGAVVAALVPIGVAGLAIVGAVGLTALVGQVTDLSFFVVNMITMIGLAVGIDYTLFVMQRFREERAAGRPKIDAIAVAGATATRAVVFSGLTVVIALLGLLLVPDTVMRSLGIGAILVVLVAVAATLTLLPALLGLLGDRVNKLRMPWARRPRPAGEGRLWTAITRTVTRRPVVSLILAGGLMVGLTIPYFGIELGSNGLDSLPEQSPSRQAFELMSEEFSTGSIHTPIVVIGAVQDPAVVDAIGGLVTDLAAMDVFGEITTEAGGDGRTVLIEATTLVDPNSSAAMDAITEVRTDVIGTHFDAVPAEALVTGTTAFNLDYRQVMADYTPLVFAMVLALSFVLLLLAFRSIVVPLKAIVMNLLSVGAAYGLLVAVFQHGVGADLLGLRQVDVIETWLPVFLFAVLFGLSMDYHVFLLSRIKERFDITGDNAGSVAFGLSATGAIITGAAAIMVAVFAGFASGELAMMQQMGFGLGAAVILDATVVRSVLVPASMALLGERNWYLPRWLEWLPDIAVEGHVTDLTAPADVVLDEPVPVGA